MRRHVLILAVAIVLLPTFASAATPIHRQNLAGVSIGSVLVEGLKGTDETISLTTTPIQTDVERLLRLSGVPLTSGTPNYLYVSVNLFYLERLQQIVYHISVKLEAYVTIGDSGLSTFGTIWDTGRTGMSRDYTSDQIRNDVMNITMRFINDYLAANPKTEGK
jgi:hypothetical protein